MKADRTVIFLKGMLCLAFLTALVMMVCIKPVMAEKEDENKVLDGSLITPEEYEKLDWNTLAAADVDDYLNVRAEADEDAQIIGRIYAGSVVTVDSEADDWTKISSGNVEGYAATEYLLFGEDARDSIGETIEWIAVVTGDDVCIRTDATVDSQTVDTVDTDDELTWDPEAPAADGWAAVVYNDHTRYISADYVETGARIGTALTNEEADEYETSNISSEDLDLLAALIYCEAGGECYAGKLAVGAVVMNRVESSSYPDTVSGVIYQSGQFSPASSGWLSSVLSSGKATDSCYEAAEEALSGVSNVGSCLHFHAGSGSGTTIGNQTFY